MASSHDKTSPRDLLQEVVTGASTFVCADLSKWNRPFLKTIAPIVLEWTMSGDEREISIWTISLVKFPENANWECWIYEVLTINWNFEKHKNLSGNLRQKRFENLGILWKCFPVSCQKFSKIQSNAKRQKIGTSLRSFFNTAYVVSSHAGLREK